LPRWISSSESIFFAQTESFSRFLHFVADLDGRAAALLQLSRELLSQQIQIAAG